MDIHVDQISAMLRRNAGLYIRPRFNALAEADILTKSSADDFVTIADLEMEKAVTDDLLALYPASRVLGEESVYADPRKMDLLSEKNGMVWVCDPVDGTGNFKRGDPHFGVLLACLNDGRLTHGWIYDVMTDRMAVAEKGAGANLDGKRLHLTHDKPQSETTGFIEQRQFPPAMQPILDSLSREFRSTASLRCSAHEYLSILDGRADFIFGGDVMPWDHLAGALCLREAGGVALNRDGSDYAPTGLNSGIVSASSAALAHHLNAALK